MAENIETSATIRDFSSRSVPELIDAICVCGLDVPPGLPEEIVKRGKDAVSPLCEIVRSKEWWDDEDPKRMWAVIHAMHLLGAIGDPTAIDALLEALPCQEYCEIFWNDLPEVIYHLGPGVLEAARRFVEDTSLDTACRSIVFEGLCDIALGAPQLSEQIANIARGIATRALQGTELMPAYMAVSLAQFHHEEDRLLLKQVFDNGAVDDEDLCGWDDVEDEFSRESPSEPIRYVPLSFYRGENLERLKQINEDYRDATALPTVAIHPAVAKASSSDLTTMSTNELIDAICHCGLEVPPGLPEEILRRGAEAVPLLCDIVRSEDWWYEPDPPRNWAVVHAMHLLGGIGDSRAMDALLEPLRRNQDSDYLTEDMAGILAHLGPEAFDVAATFVKDASQDEIYRSVAYKGLIGLSMRLPQMAPNVIALGRQMARRALVGGAPMPAGIAFGLASFQQEEDHPLLKQLYEQHAVEDISACSWEDIDDVFRNGPQDREIKYWIRNPMDFYTPENLEHLMEVEAEWDDKWEEEDSDDDEGEWESDDEYQESDDPLGVHPAFDRDSLAYNPVEPIHSEHVARNDPCPCGSGKKFKKCCGKT